MNVGIGNEAAQFLGLKKSDFRYSNWDLLAHALSLKLLSGVQGHVTGTCWLILSVSTVLLYYSLECRDM
jgi:hypothetical protein